MDPKERQRKAVHVAMETAAEQVYVAWDTQEREDYRNLLSGRMLFLIYIVCFNTNYERGLIPHGNYLINVSGAEVLDLTSGCLFLMSNVFWQTCGSPGFHR